MINSRHSLFINIISALFIFLFTYTAFSKFIEFDSFKAVLYKSPLIGSKNYLVAWSLLITELLISLLLFMPGTRLLGLYSSLVLMSVFSIYLAYMLAFTPDLPCSCGGVIKQLSWTQHFIFNIFFMLLALAGIFLCRRGIKKVKKVKVSTVVTT